MSGAFRTRVLLWCWYFAESHDGGTYYILYIMGKLKQKIKRSNKHYRQKQEEISCSWKSSYKIVNGSSPFEPRMLRELMKRQMLFEGSSVMIPVCTKTRVSFFYATKCWCEWGLNSLCRNISTILAQIKWPDFTLFNQILFFWFLLVRKCI